MVYLSLYRSSLSYAYAICMIFLNYCDCFPANILHYVLIILITDNFAIQVNNLITPKFRDQINKNKLFCTVLLDIRLFN